MKILFIGLANPGHRIPSEIFVKELEKAEHEVRYHHAFISNETPTDLTTWMQRFQGESSRWGEQIRLAIDVLEPELVISELPIFVMGEISKEYKLPWVVMNFSSFLFSIPAANLFLQASLPEFEGKKDRGNLRFIGPVVRKDPGEVSMIAKNKPIICVTQGTIADEGLYLIESAKEALSQDYNLIWENNPFHIFMPYFDVFITNGGFGGVSLAIYHGIPIICAGTTEEKPYVGRRIEKSGIGIDLKTDKPSPHEISSAAEFVLKDEKIHSNCKEFSRLAKERNLSDAVRMIEKVHG